MPFSLVIICLPVKSAAGTSGFADVGADNFFQQFSVLCVDISGAQHDDANLDLPDSGADRQCDRQYSGGMAVDQEVCSGRGDACNYGAAGGAMGTGAGVLTGLAFMLIVYAANREINP